MTTVILAVCTTLSTFKGSSHPTRSVLSQTRAAKQRAYHQVKSIRSHLHEIQVEELELGQRPGTAAMRPEVEAKLAADRAPVARHGREKNTSQAEARRSEVVRDDAQRHSQSFGVAVIYLQAAILLSSVATLLREKPVWLLGLVSGTIELAHCANGFLLVGR